MYWNQINFILNVKDLSFLLVKDANERFSENTLETIRLNSPENQIRNVDP